MQVWIVMCNVWDGHDGSYTNPVAVCTTESGAVEVRDFLIAKQKENRDWNSPNYDVEGPLEIDGEFGAIEAFSIVN